MNELVWIAAAALVIGWVVFVVLPYWPKPVEDVSASISVTGPPPSLRGPSLKVMSWNIQFAAGNANNNFRITGGRDPWPERETVTACLAEVAEVIARCSPDVILLQEVDLGARRTHQIDQLRHLRSLLGEEYTSSAYCHYWKNAFCPHPFVMGNTSMGLVTLSKHPITRATRHSLKNLASQGLMRRVFGIKRAVLSCTLQVGDAPVVVMNTHLEAFPHRYHAPTMAHQRDTLIRLMDEQGPESLTLVGGDFNLLPCPEHYEHLLEQDRAYYHPGHTEMTQLYERYSGAPALSDLLSDSHRDSFTHTCLFHTPKVADKTVDYIFSNRKGSVLGYEVLHDGTIHISDHFPLVADIALDQGRASGR